MIQDNYEDSLYFFYKTGLISRVNPDFHKNVREDSNQTEKKFWNEVSNDLIEELNRDWSYKHDLSMFGLSINEYLKSISR